MEIADRSAEEKATLYYQCEQLSIGRSYAERHLTPANEAAHGTFTAGSFLGIRCLQLNGRRQVSELFLAVDDPLPSEPKQRQLKQSFHKK